MKLTERIRKIKYLSEFIVSTAVSLFSLAEFSALAWNSPAIPKLRQPDSPVPITADESSWIAAIVKIGSIIAPIPVGWMMDRFGRKVTILAGSVPLAVGWILIGLAESVNVLYTARLLMGFAYGIGFVVIPMYLGEIASDRVRGAISTQMVIMSKLGGLYSFSLGSYVSFRTLAWLGLIPVIAFVLTFAWQPESPYFYLGKNRKEDAFASLVRLRGHRNVQAELDRMEVAVIKSQENRGTFKELFFTKGNRKALIISLGLSAAIQLSGSQSIIFYAETIFDRVHSKLRGSDATIVLGLIQLTSAIVASSLIDRIGRRPLLLISIVGVAICNTIVGVFFSLERHAFDVTGIAWLPVMAVMVYIVCFVMGLGSVTLTILGEIFPKNLKAVAGAVYAINCGIFGFTIIKLFQVVSDGLGSDYVFLGFAIFSYLFIPFVWFLVPETKGKPLDVILIEMNATSGQ